jgi:hypothetical protein
MGEVATDIPAFEITIMEVRLDDKAQAGYYSAVHDVVERERPKGSAEKSKFTRRAVSNGAQLNVMAVLVPRKPLYGGCLAEQSSDVSTPRNDLESLLANISYGTSSAANPISIARL